jgi:hypothetical protein
MPDTIASLLRIQNRYLRSVNLERDFADPKALNGYVLTPKAQDSIKQLAVGLEPKSGQRAWRITGDYGTGKSSLALLTAHLFSGQDIGLPTHLRRTVDFKEIGIARPQLLPVLVTGTREPLSVALLRSLHRALLSTCVRGRPPAVIDEIKSQIETAKGTGVPDDEVLRLLTKAGEHVTASGKGSGLLVILDELGKLLEYAALNPHRQDVFLLQTLAECAARSGSRPLFIVGLLHQGISAYADQLSESAQREWEKIAGRFEELIFNQPLEQVTILVADALKVRTELLSKPITTQAKVDMSATLDLKWYGASSPREAMIDNAAKLYPLHPTVLPVLVELFRRFGQNERSLFGFLLSNEPFGLQDFSRQPATDGNFYRLYHLYDYARATFGHRLSTLSYRSRWNQIDSMIVSYTGCDELDLQILKTVGLLNLIDINNMLASDEIISIALAGMESPHRSIVEETVKKLQRGKRALYFRGISSGYCLWPYTSVNLEKAYEDASRAIGKLHQRISSLITPYLENRPLVARRHYIETGNLRHFEVRFSPAAELSANLQFSHDTTDGLILIALCDTEEERQTALRFAQTDELRCRQDILFAVPQPLNALTQLVQELQKWEWVAANTPELNGDKYAAEEVSRQVAASRQMLEKRVHDFIGLQQFTGGTDLQWFRRHERLEIRNGRDLLSYLSAICNEVYPQAPRVHNELINRRVLSSSAAAARVRLIERIYGHSNEPALGMDPDKKPPEMSIYLSLLKEGGIHKVTKNRHELVIPDEKVDPCHIRPALEYIREFLEHRAEARVKVSTILEALRRPPFGVRDGLSPILLAVFAVINEQHTAFYKNGVFLREMAGLNIMHLTKVPEAYDIQYCKVAGIRSDLYSKLLKVLELPASKDKADVLDVVRPLCAFAAQLPSHTQKTKRVSAPALAVRTALMSAREPAILLFDQLPGACGFKPFTSEKKKRAGKEVQRFVEVLKDALDELKMVYPRLQDRLKEALAESFDLAGSFEDVRSTLARRSENILLAINEPRLKSFCLRLIDQALPEPEWLEALGSYVCSMPPAKWTDIEEDKYRQELSLLCTRFRRVEALAFRSQKRTDNETAMRIAITQLDGSEVDNVIYVSKDEESRITEVEAEITAIISRTKHIGLAATARAFWNVLSPSRE